MTDQETIIGETEELREEIPEIDPDSVVLEEGVMNTRVEEE